MPEWKILIIAWGVVYIREWWYLTQACSFGYTNTWIALCKCLFDSWTHFKHMPTLQLNGLKALLVSMIFFSRLITGWLGIECISSNICDWACVHCRPLSLCTLCTCLKKQSGTLSNELKRREEKTQTKLGSLLSSNFESKRFSICAVNIRYDTYILCPHISMLW